MLEKEPSRKISITNAEEILHGMVNDLIIKQYPHIKYRLNENTNDSYIGYRQSIQPKTKPKIECGIGIGHMLEHAENGFVRDIDLAWSAKHIGHEARRLYQMRTTFQKTNPSEYELDMARMEAIASTWVGYNRCTYLYRPAEMEADKYSLIDTVAYFENTIPDRNGNPIINIRDSLVRGTWFDYYGWQGASHAESYSRMLQSIENKIAAKEYKYRERPQEFEQTKDKWLVDQIKNHPEWAKMVQFSDHRGTSYDEKLFAIISYTRPVYIDRHACFDEYVKQVQKMYPSPQNLPEKLANRDNTILNKMDTSRNSPYPSENVRKVLQQAEEIESGNPSTAYQKEW